MAAKPAAVGEKSTDDLFWIRRLVQHAIAPADRRRDGAGFQPFVLFIVHSWGVAALLGVFPPFFLEVAHEDLVVEAIHTGGQFGHVGREDKRLGESVGGEEAQSVGQ